MGCICHATFNILLNGTTSDFFHAGRGLRQGCPLSPLLFVLVMEVLSVLIKNAKARGTLQGLQIKDILHLTHILFVDDVLIFLNGSRQDVVQFDLQLKCFCRAIGMAPNALKSTIIMTSFSGLEQGTAMNLFAYVCIDISDGLKYLGYHIKPNDYQIKDWNWLIAKIERRINV